MARRATTGRAGRLWLRDRLSTGRLAADLLDRKLRILREEQRRFHMSADQTGAAWSEALRRAQTAGLRAAMMGGRRELRLFAPPPADVMVTWASVMGLRYPVGATCRFPPTSDADRCPGTTALIEAVPAYRSAVTAAAAHAAATAACRAIDTEVADTARRLRAITDRWLPALQDQLREVSQRLEETERAETARLRWVARRSGRGGDVA
jgi:V/A-type H+-transporting ATPase subunit D